MPAFHLIDQNGKPVTLETFHGHPFVLTFIFTRCPLPNFCPRMSSNFADLQKAIESRRRLLLPPRACSAFHSIRSTTRGRCSSNMGSMRARTSPFGHSRPAHRPRFKATKGFSVLVQPESGTISHSLATALVDRDGKIAKSGAAKLGTHRDHHRAQAFVANYRRPPSCLAAQF